MKKIIKHGTPQYLKDNWRKLYDSPRERMSRGAQNLSTIISWARNENWRGQKADAQKRHKKKS
jgi:hypothetical protein